MPRRKTVFSENDIQKMKEKRMFEYMLRLVDRLTENASMLAVHILDEFLMQADTKNINEVIDALETIVPLSLNEYKYSIAMMYKLISRVSGDLYDDIIIAFEEDVCKKYNVDSIFEVNVLDRREVVRKLCDTYRGLVRFRCMHKSDRNAQDSAMAQNLHNDEKV